ncbi:hypothetical protein VSR68_06315 [Paraburkholderia phymatum]|uniref:hypothetical protein n=1 Tax=Paraburkholderia phymatum TaxID=148447 RepID=UPI00316F36D9
MRHELAGIEVAVFCLHVVIAVVLLVFIARDKSPGFREWLKLGEQSITFDLSPAPSLFEISPPPSAAPVPSVPGYTSVTNASFSVSTASSKKGP